MPDVQQVSGQSFAVLTDQEKDWFEETRDFYSNDLAFTEVTDKRDLDRLLMLELMVFRWTLWLASGQDYDHNLVDDEQVRRNIKEYSDQINKVKATMGLSKAHRDAADAAGNFNDYLTSLKQRARMFGVHRQNQLTKALALFNELSALVQTYDRADAEEREKLGFESADDVLDWVRDTAIPEYAELDEHFRNNVQTLWIRDM